MPIQPQTEPKRSRHESILDSAAFQLANYGVGNATLPEIATCIGITRSAIYYYAKSKEDLVYQVYKRSCDILVKTAEASARLPVPVPGQIAAFIAEVTSRPQTDVIALNEVGMLAPDQQSEVLARYEDAVGALAALITAGTARRELRRCDARIAAHGIVSIVQQLCMIKGWEGITGNLSPLVDVHLDMERLVEVAIDLVVNGWAGDRARAVPLDLIDLAPLNDLPDSAFDREGLARAKRTEILTTASRMFNRRGVSSTTLDDIAAELHATKRTLYHHVGDKQEILSACHARSREITNFLFDQYAKRLSMGDDPFDAHVNHLRSSALAVSDPQLEPLRLAVGLPDLQENERAAYEEFVRCVGARWQQTHAALEATGHLRALDADVMGSIHVGSINWLAKGLMTIETENRVHIVTEVIDLLRLGLSPLD